MTSVLRKQWIKDLPKTRGRVTLDAPLGGMTWFRVGGAADVLFRPADVDDLAEFLIALPAEIPVTVIGVGSNLLVRDGGVPGVVIRLGGTFARIEIMDDIITAGAGALDMTVSMTAQEIGLTGMEFLSGVPGTIGGALRMNAGAFGGEMKDVTLSAAAVDRAGSMQLLIPSDLDFSYRRCACPDDYVFISATLQGRHGHPADIAARMDSIKTARESTQPTRVRTGGSTFANPDGTKAWELIDQAGCRGMTIGGAQVSEKHCNFLLNLGDASAADIETLGEHVRRRVMETSGIELHWEIRRIGIPGEQA